MEAFLLSRIGDSIPMVRSSSQSEPYEPRIKPQESAIYVGRFRAHGDLLRWRRPDRRLSFRLRIQFELFDTGEGLGRLLSGGAIYYARLQAPARYVIPIEIFRRPAIREADFVAAALGNSLVPNDADTAHHGVCPELESVVAKYSPDRALREAAMCRTCRGYLATLILFRSSELAF
jgi:hypothetical protein